MAHKLWQLIYLSRASRVFSVADILDIERVSSDRNSFAQLSGMLLYDGAEFLQAIEGPEGAVRSTFDRIAKDPRHDQVVIAADEPILKRQFGSWAMSCRHVSSEQAKKAVSFGLEHEFREAADPNIRALFIGFAKRGQLRTVARAHGDKSTVETRALDVHLELVMCKAQAALNQIQAFREAAR
jgi:hypothetical protein